MLSKMASRTTIAAANQMSFLFIGVWHAKYPRFEEVALTVPNMA
jgi:hypothetical protein